MSRTVLLYLLADNSLHDEIQKNFDQTCKAAAAGLPDSSHLMVYFDRPASKTLYKIIPTGNRDSIIKQVVKIYPMNRSGVDKEFMKQVIEEVKAVAPARHYGLILSSHGAGWFPYRSYQAQGYKKLGQRPEGLPHTKYFGQDGSDYMDIDDLSEAISPIHWNYILFDACLMSSVEALYELRNNADRIIASPAEVLAYGFPYATLIHMLFNEKYTEEDLCSIFMTYYRGMNTANQSAAITLVECKMLDALAESFRQAFQAGTAAFSVDTIQAFEGMTYHCFYDLDHYVQSATYSAEAYAEFKKTLDATIAYHDYTPRIYSDFSWSYFPVKRCCGLTAYIPLTDRYPGLLTAYKTTAWSLYMDGVNNMD